MARKSRLLIACLAVVLFVTTATNLVFAQTELPISSATASSYYGFYTPSKAIDNNLSTYWQGARFFNTYWWLKLDLGNPYSLTKISIFWHKDYGSTNYNIQASNNGTTWTNLYTALSSTGGTTNPYQKDYSLSGSYRYIRIYINQAQMYYPIIYEVKLYGQAADTTAPTTPQVTDDGSTTTSTTQLHATWSSSDPESGISEYQYRITQDSTTGTVIVDWTSTGTANNVTKTGLSLTVNKTYYFAVKAKNGTGLWSSIGYSDGITVIASADTTPPQVSITQPSNGAAVSGVVDIQAQATDNVGVSKVEFYIDDVLKSQDTTSPYTYSWNTTTYTNASHNIKAVAYDTSNNTGQHNIIVTVNNPTSGELPISSATASSYYGFYTPSKAIDNNLSTYWQGGRFFNTYWWLKLDLGNPYSLTKISIFWHKDYGSTNYNIQASNNGTTWTNLYTALSSTGGTTNPYQKDYSLSGSYRYIRIYINKAQMYYPIIYEVKLYGIPPDTTPPTGTIKINNDAVYTNSTQVTLNLSATDTASGMAEGSQMQFSNDGTTYSTPEAYVPTKAWTLTDGDGTKTVYVKYKDAGGNWSNPVSDTIVLDTIVPTTTDSGIDGLWHNSPVTVTLTATDLGSGIDKTYYSTDGTTPTLVYTQPFSLSDEGTFTIKYYSQDKAGNSESIKTSANQVKIDKASPTGSILINNGANFTNSTSVTLNLSATDTASGMAEGSQMQFSNDGTTYSTPEAYAPTKAWTLTDGDGTKTVYVKYKDAGGNWSTAYSDTIVLDTTPPVIIITSPEDGSILSLPQVTLEGTVDGVPFQEIRNLAHGTNILTKESTDEAGNRGSASVTVIYNIAPTITNLIPQNNSSFTETDLITIQVIATDPDNDPLQYQYYIDNNIKQPWSSNSTYNWQTQIGDNNGHIIKVEVKDQYGFIDSKQSSIYIFRKPIAPPMR